MQLQNEPTKDPPQQNTAADPYFHKTHDSTDEELSEKSPPRSPFEEPSKNPPLPPCCCSVAVVLLLLSAAVILLLLFCYCLYCQERRRCKKILPPHRSKRSSRTTDDNSTVKNDDGMVFFVRYRSIDDGGVKRTHQNGPAVSRVIRLSQKPRNYEDGRLTKAPIFCTTAITRR